MFRHWIHQRIARLGVFHEEGGHARWEGAEDALDIGAVDPTVTVIGEVITIHHPRKQNVLRFENVKTVDPTFETAPWIRWSRVDNMEPTHRYLEDIFIFGRGGLG